ncbi:MAG: hypothetical protein IOMNBAOH_01738 [Rhodocyclaceae bacterium]|nr:hypothetical protein [Rhodocyclaceae bacterium]
MSARRALSHTQCVLINRLATPAGAFIILIIIGRHSDTLLGQYALVMTFYYIMQMLPLLGLTSYVMREVARRPEQAGRYFTSIGGLSLLGCVAVDVLCYFYLLHANYPVAVNHGIAVIGILIFPGILLFLAEIIFMSMDWAKPVALVALFENVARVIMSLAALALGGELTALIWVFLITRSGALLAYLWIMHRNGMLSGSFGSNGEIYQRTFRVLPSFFIGTVFFVVFSRMDFVVLSLYWSAEVIGYYAIGYRLFDIGLVVLTALIMALFPWVARKFSASPLRFRVAARNVVLFLTAGLLVVAFAGAMLSEYFVQIFFSAQYPRPVVLTQLFFVALFFCGLDFVASSVMHASDMQSWDTKASAIGGASNVALLFGLIPEYGIYGAFAAKLGSTCVQGAIKFFIIEKATSLGWRTRELISLFAIIGFVVTFGATFLHAPLLVKLPIIMFMSAAVVPCLFAWTGLFRPVRVLRYYWRPRRATDVWGLANLIDVVVAEFRCHRRSRLDRTTLALVVPPLARYFHLRGQATMASLCLDTAKVLCPMDPHTTDWRKPMRSRPFSLFAATRESTHR